MRPHAFHVELEVLDAPMTDISWWACTCSRIPNIHPFHNCHEGCLVLLPAPCRDRGSPRLRSYITLQRTVLYEKAIDGYKSWKYIVDSLKSRLKDGTAGGADWAPQIHAHNARTWRS